MPFLKASSWLGYPDLSKERVIVCQDNPAKQLETSIGKDSTSSKQVLFIYFLNPKDHIGFCIAEAYPQKTCKNNWSRGDSRIKKFTLSIKKAYSAKLDARFHLLIQLSLFGTTIQVILSGFGGKVNSFIFT